MLGVRPLFSGDGAVRLKPTLLALLLAPATAWSAAEVGTCLTGAGVVVAPWTDGADPACGSDCGDEGETPVGEPSTLCSVEAGGCGPTEEAPPLAWPSEPRGPRCLEPGPECAPGAPATASVWTSAAAAQPDVSLIPQRASGTLPGPGMPQTDHPSLENPRTPETPPPR